MTFVKKSFLLLTVLVMMMTTLPATAESAAFSGTIIHTYDSPTLRYTVEEFTLEGALCYLTRIWMADPGRQILKATAHWEKDLSYPSDMAKQIPQAALAINGSGYVSPVFPWIPENYPGTSPDYHYTPLGSLTITNGEIFRNLPGVPYYGLTLQKDGLHLHVGEDNEAVLSQQPTQTWSFYVECPLIQDGVSILDRSWPFANRKAIRNMIGQVDENNYVILTVSHKAGRGLTVVTCVDFLTQHIKPWWMYNLDGGPSAALLVRSETDTTLQVLYGNTSKDTDIMGFCE